jgi:small subunit ribosomal protein S20
MIHPSAEKRARQTQKRTLRNRNIRTALRTALKRARIAISSRDAAAKATVALALQALAKAASKGVIHANTAARTTSRLARALHHSSSAKTAS